MSWSAAASAWSFWKGSPATGTAGVTTVSHPTYYILGF